MIRGIGPGSHLRRGLSRSGLPGAAVFFTLFLLTLPAPGARAACPCAYIPNSGGSSVSVVDLTSNSVTATITGIAGSPWGAAVNTSGMRVFVTRLNGGAMAVIDASNNTVIGTVTGLNRPYSAVVHPLGNYVYVTNSNLATSTVSVVNTSTNLVTATIPVGKEPYGIAITPDGSRLFVANSNASATATSTVSVISTASNTVTTTIPGFSSARNIAINPAGTRAYISDYGANTVVVLDLVNDLILGPIPVGVNPEGIAVSPLGSPVYAVSYRSPGTVAVIDASTNSVVTSFTVGGFPLGAAFHPNGGAAYVVNSASGSNSVSVVSVPASSVTGAIGVGGSPIGYGGFIVSPPRTASLSPAVRPVNSGAFTLTVNGTMFNAWPGIQSQVLWNGSPRATTFISANQLTAAITAADVSAAGTATVRVNSPAPGGGLSHPPALSVTICAGPPSPGNSLRVTKQSPTVRLGWVDLSGAGATGYNVKRCIPTATPCIPAPFATTAVNGYNDSVLGNSISYFYGIESYNACTYTP